MSIDLSTRTSLGAWIARLVRALDSDPYGGGRRLRQVVGRRRARIVLDDDAVLVAMDDRGLVIGPDNPSAIVDGAGLTTSRVVLSLLAGDLEAVAAIELGLIEVTGSPEAVTEMFHAVELILDGAARLPELRDLATSFVSEAGSSPPLGTIARAPRSVDQKRIEEVELLRSLGLVDYRAPGDGMSGVEHG